MWLFTNKGFLSVIQDFRDPDTLIVRSRFPGHIQNLFPDAKVTRTTSRDYLYRALLPRREVAEALKRYTEEMDYTNFKDSVDEPTYQRACLEVWGAVRRHQK
jgi:predicted ATP-dependent Lon-type protease